MKRFCWMFLVASLLALFTVGAWGQTTTGNVFGTVTDKTGAAVPGATVTVTDINKGTKFTTTSNASGNYTVTQLVPDPYTVTVEAKGFQKFVQTNVTVQADSGVKVDAAMTVGQVSQTVEVTSAPPLLKTDRADVSTTLNTRQVTDIPVVNRNFTDLQLMLPGAVQLGWNHAASENPQRSAQIDVNGQSFSGTDYLLDGTDNRDAILGIIVINPNLDSIQEVKMSTGDYDAQFGALGAVMSAQTKSGTNQFHGEGYDYIQNDQIIQARDPFTQSQPNSITGKFNDPLRYNQFGGTFGGPIVKNKLFFFGDYQGLIRHRASHTLTFVPTAAERGGDFSALLTPPNGGTPIQLYDPATGNPDGTGRTPFAGDKIDPSRLDPVAGKVFGMLPMPNYTDPSNPSVNYLGTGTEMFHSNAFDTREDWNISDKTQMFGRYSLSQYSLSAPGAFGDVLGGPPLNNVNFAGTSTSRDQSLALGLTRTLTPNLLTDFHFGFYRYRVSVDNPTLGKDYANQLGIPNVNLGDYFTSGYPSFELDGGAGVIGTTTLGYAVHNIANNNQCNCPLRENSYQMQFLDDWTYITGNHILKWGADLRHAHNLRVPSDNSRNGQFFFKGDPTSQNGTSNSGVGLASFFLGDVSSFMRYVSPYTDAAESQNRFFFYGQDTWRITPTLTLNYGLRWSYYSPQAVNGPGKGGWFDFNNANVIVAGYGPYNLQGNVKPQYSDFAPRIGLAWQFTPKTVVRVGYGRSYDVGVFGTLFGHTVTQNLPVLAFQDVEPTNVYAGSFVIDNGPPSGMTPAYFPDTSVYSKTGEYPLPDGVNVHANERNLVVPYVDSWSLAIQRQLSANTSVSMTYLGNKGTHIGATPNINSPTAIPSPTATDNGLSLSPYFQKFGLTQGITDYCNCDSNNYNALQIKLDHNFSHGLQINANYTWSRSMGFNGSWYYGWNYGYGPTSQDIGQVLNISHNYELPIGHGRHFLGNAHGLLDAVVGGWTFNGDTAIHSGLPTTPGYNGQGCPKCPFQTWPDRVGDPYSGGNAGSQAQFWNPAAFKAVPATLDQPDGTKGTGIQRNGSAGWDSLRGPMFWVSNLSLFKNFHITERVSAQFRVETFNTFNHDNWAVPDSNIADSSFGKVTSTQQFAADQNNMRSGQLALKISF